MWNVLKLSENQKGFLAQHMLHRKEQAKEYVYALTDAEKAQKPYENLLTENGNFKQLL